jgi:glycosyltransferase involved in cell wall biosynthesis
MKIAFISTIFGYPWGGADVLWTRTAARALAAGHQVLVAVSAECAAHPRIAALQAAGARLHLRNGFTAQRGRSDQWRQTLARTFRTRGSLTAALDAFRPDQVCLSQGGVFDFLAENGLVQWLAETKCAYTPVCQSNDERETVSSDLQAAARRFLAAAQHTVFVSTHNRDHAGRQLGAAVPRAIIVTNPVELPPGPPPAWPAATTPRLAVVARLESDPKGLDVLLQALTKLGPRGDWRVDLYGRGPDEATLRTEITRLGLGERIHFGGFTPDIRQIWESHHLLLLSSRREGCALAMLEALACGRPVLTTETGGARDWIEPGVNGYLCPTGDATALATAISAALTDFARWPELGAAARRIFTARHPTEPETQLLGLLSAHPCGKS